MFDSDDLNNLLKMMLYTDPAMKKRAENNKNLAESSWELYKKDPLVI